MTCDLHTHSLYSDGTCTPQELIEAAEAASLHAIALTDHNTISGLPEFFAAAKGKSLEPIGGIELSTDNNGTELHILGLYLEESCYDTLRTMLRDYQQRKEESNLRLVEALRGAGYDIDYAAIRDKTPDGQVNRALIGAALLQKGYVTSIKEAFTSILAEKHGYYVPPKRISSIDAIAYLRSIGAVTVLAHPLLNLTPDALDTFLSQAVAAGLDAMETRYATYSPSQTTLADALAEKHHLLPSGGSDFHGANKPDIALGCGYGNLMVPLAYHEALKFQKSMRKDLFSQ